MVFGVSGQGESGESERSVDERGLGGQREIVGPRASPGQLAHAELVEHDGELGGSEIAQRVDRRQVVAGALVKGEEAALEATVEDGPEATAEPALPGDGREAVDADELDLTSSVEPESGGERHAESGETTRATDHGNLCQPACGQLVVVQQVGDQHVQDGAGATVVFHLTW